MKASDLLIKALENEGVKYIFTVPGEETLDIIESIRKSKQIKLIVLRHEQGAGFMAATYGRLTNKAGVCLVTLGPGATNLMTSTAYAQLGGMPMVVITGQKPIKKHPQGEFQVINVVSMMQPITKMSRQIVNINNIGALVRKAFHIAEEERPGVVHIELPEDIAKEKIKKYNILQVNEIKRPIADSSAIKKACELISNSEVPLLLIGAGANRKKVSNALQKFVNKLSLPFFTTQMGKGVVDEKDNLYLGTAAITKGDLLHKAIAKADLIINAGHDIIEKPPFVMTPNGTKVIHINFSSAVIDDTYFPQLEIVGDIATTIENLTKLLVVHKRWNFEKIKQIKNQINKRRNECIKNSKFPIVPESLVYELQNLIPKNSILALDNGLYKICFAKEFLSSFPHSILLDNALATMGAGLPSAMAARLIFPKNNVMAICGDGGFLMNSHELEPAIRYNLDLTILILNDNAYGMIKWKQKNMGLENFGMDYNNPNFIKYAEAYGAEGYKPKNIEEFRNIVNYCIQNKGVKIIEVPIDYKNYLKGIS